jgi:ATP-dependent Clp protease ATP-binding subunit ClpA
MTSNLGSDYINKMSSIGFNTREELEQRESMKEKITDSLKEAFRPEFLNRIDEIVIFNYLKKEQIKTIVDLELAKVEKRLARPTSGHPEIKIEISENAKEFLVKEGFDPNLGARPLKRVIQRLILDPLSIKIVTNEIAEGSRIFIDEQAGKMVFESPRVLPRTIDRKKLATAKR